MRGYLTFWNDTRTVRPERFERSLRLPSRVSWGPQENADPPYLHRDVPPEPSVCSYALVSAV